MSEGDLCCSGCGSAARSAEFAMKAIPVRNDPIAVTMDEAHWLFFPRAALHLQ